MKKVTLTLLSKDPNNNLSIDVFDDSSLLTFISIFQPTVDPEKHTIQVNSIYEVSTNIKENVRNFVDHFKEEFPYCRKLISFFSQVSCGEHIALVLNIDHGDIKSAISIFQYLESLDNPDFDFDSQISMFNDLYSYALDNYTVFTSSIDRKTWIGEPDKNLRVCRFCNRSIEDGASFHHIAHAIPESLGNKKSLLNEECDSCNSHFSGTIETAFTDFLKIHTVFFGVKNKSSKVPKLKGSNFEYSKAADGGVVIKYIDDLSPENETGPSTATLNTNSIIRVQDLYKALCKFALSIIDTNMCPAFAATFRWIRRNYVVKKLPNIGTFMSYQMFTKEPIVTIYIRKTDDKSAPYAIAEFRYLYLTYVFLIPVFSRYEDLFLVEGQFEEFITSFAHYQKLDGLGFQDFSDSRESFFHINLKFSKQESS